MTPQTETTETRPASAIGRREGGGEGGNAQLTATPAGSAGSSLLKWPCLVWLVGSAIGTIVLGQEALGETAGGFLTVGVICFAATIASLLPIRNLARGPADALPLGLLSTIAIRGGTTLCLLIAAIAAGWVERATVALPIVLWYMAFLITDLVVVNRFLSEALPISVRPRSERTTC